MSINLVVCLAALLGASFAAHKQEVPSIRAVTDWERPKWYRGKDGPIFQIVQTLDEVELRGYEAGKWVTTNITGVSFDDAYKQGTQKLDDYWKGNNQPQPGQPGTKIDNTVPTVVLLYPTGQTKAVQQLFTIEYFLPHELHAAPPQPTTAELNILDVQPNQAWVRVFGGYAGEKEVMDQAFGFLDQLRGEKLNIDESVIAVAYYDDPVRIINRHNEIWIWSKDAPSVEEMAKTWLQRLEAVLPWRR